MLLHPINYHHYKDRLYSGSTLYFATVRQSQQNCPRSSFQNRYRHSQGQGLTRGRNLKNRRVGCSLFDLRIRRHFAAYHFAPPRLHFWGCPLLPHRHCLYFLPKLPPYLGCLLRRLRPAYRLAAHRPLPPHLSFLSAAPPSPAFSATTGAAGFDGVSADLTSGDPPPPPPQAERGKIQAIAITLRLNIIISFIGRRFMYRPVC